jgi:hypothetical protein
MKYIITENQQRAIADNIAEIIKSHLSEYSTWICDIVAHPTDSDEDESIFDIYVYLKLSELKKFNDLTQNRLLLTIKHKIQDFVETWFFFKSNDFYVGILVKDC